jgi:hypothetical protein
MNKRDRLALPHPGWINHDPMCSRRLKGVAPKGSRCGCYRRERAWRAAEDRRYAVARRALDVAEERVAQANMVAWIEWHRTVYANRFMDPPEQRISPPTWRDRLASTADELALWRLADWLRA